jgi:hypothetical protein
VKEGDLIDDKQQQCNRTNTQQEKIPKRRLIALDGKVNFVCRDFLIQSFIDNVKCVLTVSFKECIKYRVSCETGSVSV